MAGQTSGAPQDLRLSEGDLFSLLGRLYAEVQVLRAHLDRAREHIEALEAENGRLAAAAAPPREPPGG